MSAASTPPPVTNVMTIDVEDYYHVTAFEGLVQRSQWDEMASRVVENTVRLLDLFAAHDVRATFFVLGWVAQKQPALVRRIADAGHELASHSFWHRLVYSLTPADFRADLRDARHAIEDAGGRQLHGFRAPTYSITDRSLWALDVLAEEGYAYDASIFPIRHDRYGIPSAPRHPYVVTTTAGSLLEIPGTTVLVAGLKLPIGGGYFRLMPYAMTEWAIARLNARERRPAMFYLHPWEIDPDQPRITRNWRHYCQLARTESRLTQLLRRFKWGAVADVLGPQMGRPDAAPGVL